MVDMGEEKLHVHAVNSEIQMPMKYEEEMR